MLNEVSCERRSVTIKMEHNLADQLNCMEAAHKLELQCMVQRHEESSRALELARADTCKLNIELAGIREQTFRVRRLFEQEGAALDVALQQIKASRRRTTGLLAVLNGALGGREAVPVKKEVPEQTGTRFQLVTDAEEEKTADINQTLSQKRMTQGSAVGPREATETCLYEDKWLDDEDKGDGDAYPAVPVSLPWRSIRQ